MEVLCMSSYAAESCGSRGDPPIAYLQKPLTADALATRVRSVLDGEADPPASRR
jgi:hypothetical protein